MRYLLAIALVLVIRGTLLQSRAMALDEAQPVTRFEAVHVSIDSGDAALGAYQVQLSDPHGRIQVVGVENGQHAAFGEAPFYDRQAVNQGRADRIIIAAYSTLPAEQLPTGSTRVATIHLQVTGDSPVNYQVQLIAAADADGNKINASVNIQPGTQP